MDRMLVVFLSFIADMVVQEAAQIIQRPVVMLGVSRRGWRVVRAGRSRLRVVENVVGWRQRRSGRRRSDLRTRRREGQGGGYSRAK